MTVESSRYNCKNVYGHEARLPKTPIDMVQKHFQAHMNIVTCYARDKSFPIKLEDLSRA